MEAIQLKSAGSTYQRLVHVVFRDQVGKNLEVYIDDMVIKSKHRSSFLADVQGTFANLRRHNLKFNPKKCIFGELYFRAGKFLGYMSVKRRIPTKWKLLLTY